jgi:hypothetical protein
MNCKIFNLFVKGSVGGIIKNYATKKSLNFSHILWYTTQQMICNYNPYRQPSRTDPNIIRLQTIYVHLPIKYYVHTKHNYKSLETKLHRLLGNQQMSNDHVMRCLFQTLRLIELLINHTECNLPHINIERLTKAWSGKLEEMYNYLDTHPSDLNDNYRKVLDYYKQEIDNLTNESTNESTNEFTNYVLK